MKNSSFRIILLAICWVLFAGCQNNQEVFDGKGTPIEASPDKVECDAAEYTYTITTKHSFWWLRNGYRCSYGSDPISFERFTKVVCADKGEIPPDKDTSSTKICKLFSETLTIIRTSETSLEVTVGKNDKPQTRTIQFTLHGGNAGQYITIVQAAAKQEEVTTE